MLKEANNKTQILTEMQELNKKIENEIKKLQKEIKDLKLNNRKKEIIFEELEKLKNN